MKVVALRKRGKKKPPLHACSPEADTRIGDNTLVSMMNETNRINGQPSVMVASHGHDLIIGLPLPSIALEWVLANSVIPLSQMIQIVGLPGSCKSALVYEIFRWFNLYGGISILVENETKFSLDLLNSILEFDAKHTLVD